MAVRPVVTLAWFARDGSMVGMTGIADSTAPAGIPDGATSYALLGMSVETDELNIVLDGDRPMRMSVRWP